jgi:predicted GIY-YIG superfamily endonuclease
MPSWAYMLLCADGSFYTGCTTDLDTRFGQASGRHIRRRGTRRLEARTAAPACFETRRLRRSSA